MNKLFCKKRLLLARHLGIQVFALEHKTSFQSNTCGPVVVTWLVDRLLPTPAVRSSKPVMGKNLYRTFSVKFFEKVKIKK